MVVTLGPSKQWTTIAAELKEAHTDQMKKNVDVASAVLGIDPEHMQWLIQESAADRNNNFHNQVRDLITNCKWPQPAAHVCRDIKELLLVSLDSKTAERYEKVLLYIRDEYFEVENEDASKF
jgi:hypothetical protein